MNPQTRKEIITYTLIIIVGAISAYFGVQYGAGKPENINWREYEIGKQAAIQELQAQFQTELQKKITELQVQYDAEVAKLTTSTKQ